jgi:transcriptional repressor NrdR
VLCPFCSFESTRVVDSRLTEPGDAIRRRRECAGCANRFTTYERAEAASATVVKRDGRREHFDRQKLLRGLGRAANKRPVTDEQLEQLADWVAAEVRGHGPEVDAERLGELSLRGLARIDPVSAILFASVYRQFADLGELEAEVRRLKEEPATGTDQLALEDPSVPSDSASSIGRSPIDARSERSADVGQP